MVGNSAFARSHHAGGRPEAHLRDSAGLVLDTRKHELASYIDEGNGSALGRVRGDVPGGDYVVLLFSKGLHAPKGAGRLVNRARVLLVGHEAQVPARVRGAVEGERGPARVDSGI